MPSHPHPPHTQSDRCLLVVTCSILHPFSCFQGSPKGRFIPWLWSKKLPTHPIPVFCLTLVPLVRFTVARTHELHSQPTSTSTYPTATAMPSPSPLPHGLFWLCFTSGPLPTPRLCTPVPEQTPEAGSSCFEQPAQTVLLQGSNPKWQIQDHLPATGQLELGKLDKAVVHSLEGRQGYVGWDISSSLKHRWEQPPFSEVSPWVKEVNTALWDMLCLWGFQALCQEPAPIPTCRAARSKEKVTVSCVWQPPPHIDQPWTSFLVESSIAEPHKIKHTQLHSHLCLPHFTKNTEVCPVHNLFLGKGNNLDSIPHSIHNP